MGGGAEGEFSLRELPPGRWRSGGGGGVFAARMAGRMPALRGWGRWGEWLFRLFVSMVGLG
jgi:hypothetical protein